MKKTFLKVILLTSIVSISISSCQKEYDEMNDVILPETNLRARNGGHNPPVANAGADQVIFLPINTASLQGSATDPDNNITSYLWTKIAGPSPGKIVSPKSAQTQVINLVEGTYRFELKVTDKTKLFDKDTVQVTVTFMNLPLPCTTCKIVFVSARDGNNEIYTCNTDGSNITRLTNDPGDDGQPKWSADGTRIAFTSNRDGNYEIYIMNADGSNVVQRTFSEYPYEIMGLTWSPDGTKIAYSGYTDDYGMYAIYVVDATNGSPVFLSSQTDYDMNPAWSPDGTKIALSGEDFDGSAEGYYYYAIYTINSNDGSGSGVLTPISYLSVVNYPSWSPNGAKLAMVYNSQVGVINSDGSGFTLLMPGAAPWTAGTSWSADGTVIVYTSVSGSMYNVSWVAVNGSAGGTIITNAWNADWQPIPMSQ